MKRFISVLLCAVICAAIFAGCVPDPIVDVTVEDGYDYARFMGQDVKIYVHNWGEYISDGTDGSLDINAAFEKLTGIEVEYITYDTNESLYAKFKSGGFEGDIVIPSDYMIERLIAEGYAQKLDYSNIPNFSFISDRFKNLSYDEANEYTVPYTYGVVGIIYNTTKVSGEITSWDSLWDPAYEGEILMFDNSRDAFGISLLRLGYDINSTDKTQIAEAAAQLKEQKQYVQAYVMDQIFDKMGGGEAALAPYYNGDAVTMIAENPDLAFVIPEEGTNYFVDCMMIPASSQNKEAAEMYINFMLETEVAVANAEYIGYSSPNQAAYEALPDEIKNDPVSYPTEEQLENTQVFSMLPTETSTLVADYWNEIKGYDDDSRTFFETYGVLLMLGVAAVAAVAILVIRGIKHKKREY